MSAVRAYQRGSTTRTSSRSTSRRLPRTAGARARSVSRSSETGAVVSAGSILINPETDFSPYNVAITGISPESVADAPILPELWPELGRLLDGQLVAAHVASFDLGVLRQSVARYELDGISLGAVCSWRLSRDAWPELPAFGLGYLGQHLALDFDHQAGDDARVCAEVLLRAERDQNVPTLRELVATLGMAHGRLTPESFVGVQIGSEGLNNMTGAEDADPDHPLFARHVCFTGALLSMTRREAPERIVEFGADFKNRGPLTTCAGHASQT